MPIIDLTFALRGTTIPLDAGYALFSAISRIVPSLHGDRRVGVHPIRGIKRERGRLSLVPQSRLRLRMPSEEVVNYLRLAGSCLELDGSRVRVGMPSHETLGPSEYLASRLVTIGHLTAPDAFLESVDRQLRSELGVEARAILTPANDPARAGEPTRRIVRVRGRQIVGYAVQVEGLTDEGSLVLQERGLGSRRRLGCGLFTPRQGRRPAPA